MVDRNEIHNVLEFNIHATIGPTIRQCKIMCMNIGVPDIYWECEEPTREKKNTKNNRE